MLEEAIIRSPDTERANRVPPGQRLTERFPVLHYGGVPTIESARWTLSLYGLVEKQVKLTFEEFVLLPHVQVFADLHCVTGWSKLDTLWGGISTSVLKDLVSIRPEARYAIVHGAGHFTTNLALDDFFQPDVLLALTYGGQPITADHGAPVRLVVPRLYFWKSAKWVTGVEFTVADRLGFWESRGYHRRGDPWKEERYAGAF